MIDILKLMHTVRKAADGKTTVTLETADDHDDDLAGILRIESEVDGQRYEMWADLRISKLREVRLDATQYGVYLAESFNQDLRAHMQATE